MAMVNWGRAERSPVTALETLEVEDLCEQLDSIRSRLKDLSRSLSGDVHRQFGRARHLAAETAEEAEETMKEHLAASMALGVAIGYLLRRETE
jgi:hypothetical protein